MVQPQNPPPTNRRYLTVDEVLAELKIARSTFHEWRATGRGPRCSKLPNGQLRISRRDLDTWMTKLTKEAA